MQKFVFLLFGAVLGWFASQQFGEVRIHQVVQILTQSTPITPQQQAVQTPIVPVQKTIIPASDRRVIEQNDNYAPKRLMNNALAAIQAGKYQQALVNIENLLAQVQNVYPTDDIEKMFIDTTKKYLQQLGDNNPQAKVNFLNKAIDILPNELQFHYQLAKLFLSLEYYQQAQYEMSFLVNNVKWKAQFDKLQAQLDYAKIFQQGDIAIPLIKLTNAWHINVLIDNTAAQFILDTGASSSVVSEYLIDKNYQRSDKIVLSTANGTLEAFAVKVERFSVGEIVNHKFTVVVLPKAKLPAGIDGLLGLDWLSNFDFVIDKKNSLLRLTPVVN